MPEWAAGLKAAGAIAELQYKTDKARFAKADGFDGRRCNVVLSLDTAAALLVAIQDAATRAPSPSGARTPEVEETDDATRAVIDNIGVYPVSWHEPGKPVRTRTEWEEGFNAAVMEITKQLAERSGAGARTDSPKDWRTDLKAKDVRDTILSDGQFDDEDQHAWMEHHLDALCDAVAACSRSGEVRRG